MHTQTMEFAVTRQNGIVTQVGMSSVIHPAIDFKCGNGIKWYQDKPKQADK